MQITLSPELEKRLREQMARGGYDDPNDLIADALDAHEDHLPPPPELRRPGGPYDHPWTVEKLRRALQVGIDQADRGESSEWNVNELKAELRRRIEAKQSTSADQGTH